MEASTTIPTVEPTFTLIVEGVNMGHGFSRERVLQEISLAEWQFQGATITTIEERSV